VIHVLRHGQIIQVHGVSEGKGGFALLRFDGEHGFSLVSFDTEELMEEHLHANKH
jgi:hypothetical protein